LMSAFPCADSSRDLHSFPTRRSSDLDGSLGLLEGHASKIYYDGSQQYRYWMRADVQGEAGFALAAAADYLREPSYNKKAANVIDYIFNSNLRSGPRADQNSPSFGLMGWSV